MFSVNADIAPWAATLANIGLFVCLFLIEVALCALLFARLFVESVSSGYEGAPFLITFIVTSFIPITFMLPLVLALLAAVIVGCDAVYNGGAFAPGSEFSSKPTLLRFDPHPPTTREDYAAARAHWDVVVRKFRYVLACLYMCYSAYFLLTLPARVYYSHYGFQVYFYDFIRIGAFIIDFFVNYPIGASVSFFSLFALMYRLHEAWLLCYVHPYERHAARAVFSARMRRFLRFLLFCVAAAIFTWWVRP